MKKWTIRQRVLNSFAVILALMLIMGGIAYERLHHVAQETASLQADSLPGVYRSANVIAALEQNYALL